MAKPSWMHQRVYQWVKPRSLGLHLLFFTVATGCGFAADWQIHRAASGNTLSYLYAVEWPTFAIVGGIGWWQLFHDTPEDIARRRAHHDRMRRASQEVVARTLPRSATALTVGSAEVGVRAVGSAGGRRAIAVSADDNGAAPLVRRSAENLPDVAGVRLLADDATDPDDELAQYNQYLATLAIKGRAKTWRNPRGES
jgi:hypothetical protein